MDKFNLAHVTHEAVEQLGGIGTVLEGLMISPVYHRHVLRSILVGPTQVRHGAPPESRLGDHGTLLYSSADKIDKTGLAGRFKPIEWAFDVKIVYGRRHYAPPQQGRTGEAEVLLIDVSHPNAQRLGVFKLRLWETFGIDSANYENAWDFEEYVRLAEPALYCLHALLDSEPSPCVIFGHEFMGMPTALAAVVDETRRFRTVFHAHECATARRIVEDHEGHDTMFYNVLDQALARNKTVDEVFGSQDANLRHALVSRAHLCDGVIAVGDRTRDELRFLNQPLREQPIDLVYNGVPAAKISSSAREKSRKMLLGFSKALMDFEPDLIMTHVTRPVVSKGLWRDLKVCHALDGLLKDKGKTAVLYILTTAGGVRSPEDVARMEKQYDWPRHHHEGYPDLVGPEVDINHMIEPFNARHEQVKVVLVNQFGWSNERIGSFVPEKMDMADFRQATDVEFGMATYEPFGISPLEPLGSGALCVISNVCGCMGFVQHVTQGEGAPNVIVANFVDLEKTMPMKVAKQIDSRERHLVEERVSAEVASTIMDRLAWTAAGRSKLLESGQQLVARMGWDQVIEEGLLPMLERICRS